MFFLKQIFQCLLPFPQCQNHTWGPLTCVFHFLYVHIPVLPCGFIHMTHLSSLDFHAESNIFLSSCLSGDFAFSFSKEMSLELIPGGWLFSSSALWTPFLCFQNSIVSGEKAHLIGGSPVSDIIFPLLLSRCCLCLTFSHGWWGTRVLYWKVMGLLGQAGLCGACDHTLRVLFMSLSSLLPAGMPTVPVPLHSALSVFLIGTVTFLLQAA